MCVWMQLVRAYVGYNITGYEGRTLYGLGAYTEHAKRKTHRYGYQALYGREDCWNIVGTVALAACVS